MTKEYIKAYRDKRRVMAIELLGGKCCKCPATETLQFDHITPEDKVNEISSMLTTKLSVFLAELKKCQLLCYSCHLKKSIENGDLIFGREGWKHNLSGYINQNCRCDICKAEYKIYRKERWKNKRV
jgi:5-methylcytosine-specific restriction endonuclease McrA